MDGDRCQRDLGWSAKDSCLLCRVICCSVTRTHEMLAFRIIIYSAASVCTDGVIGHKLITGQMDEYSWVMCRGNGEYRSGISGKRTYLSNNTCTRPRGRGCASILRCCLSCSTFSTRE